MAKRRRLTPANPAFLGGDPARTPTPMRAPIAEVARETSATAAVEEMARTLSEAREEGRMVVRVPLGAVQLDHLVRDRVVADDEDMAALERSIAARGQQTPVELADLGAGRYGLISGWRRIKALAALHARTGEERFAQVLGLIRRPAERADAYVAMVEENEIRVGLSYFERARIVAKAVEQGVFDSDREGLQTLFDAASRAKRSKIGSFLPLVRAFDGVLRFPHALSERQGLALSRALAEDDGLADRVRDALRTAAPDTPEAETAVLDNALRAASAAPASKAAAKVERTPEPVPEPAATPRRAINVVTGIALHEDSEGRLVLEGNRVDATLKARLVAWLRGQ
ncbi:ParB/RepB/Spo0J family partition protein [Citreimonas salinaria]|uniref:ParB-like nuclease domain-containing protein n=1 Tax=Citreimonas salinaria TaxID=321339 RepID=A0A1H3N3T3_9RHOB|nr:ParB N-terminal domain-containing protein [Citreimonas salinaria]SDY83621.1 ParB-like nuclease domain-containing protein [Citreimonas salinaria]